MFHLMVNGSYIKPFNHWCTLSLPELRYLKHWDVTVLHLIVWADRNKRCLFQKQIKKKNMCSAKLHHTSTCYHTHFSVIVILLPQPHDPRPTAHNLHNFNFPNSEHVCNEYENCGFTFNISQKINHHLGCRLWFVSNRKSHGWYK